MNHEIPGSTLQSTDIVDLFNARWNRRVVAILDDAAEVCRVQCRPAELRAICEWLWQELDYAFATLVVEDSSETDRMLTYVFYKDAGSPWIYVEFGVDARTGTAPSVVDLAQGPSVDWHEREVEDLFGLKFEGHPRLGEFVLHEDWPEGSNPMRRGFDARRMPRARRI